MGLYIFGCGSLFRGAFWNNTSKHIGGIAMVLTCSVQISAGIVESSSYDVCPSGKGMTSYMMQV